MDKTGKIGNAAIGNAAIGNPQDAAPADPGAKRAAGPAGARTDAGAKPAAGHAGSDSAIVHTASDSAIGRAAAGTAAGRSRRGPAAGTHAGTGAPVRKLTLVSLTWPIFIEIALNQLMGIVDTFMLSHYHEGAVAAVGASNQILMFFNLMFGFVAAGTTILVSRHLGAGNEREARGAAAASVSMNLLFGLMMSLVLFAGAETFLNLIGLPEELMGFGKSYLTIIGSFVFLQALMLTMSGAVKSYGFTRNVMVINLVMNALHVVLNGFFLYGWLGVPVLGVPGVAASTVASRAVGLAITVFVLLRVVGRLEWDDLIRPKKRHVTGLLKIGVPSAGENLSYNVSQLVITSFIATLGVTAMVTRVYTLQIIFLITLFSSSVAQGTQILVARMIGAKDFDGAYRRGLASLGICLLLTLLVAGVINLAGGVLMDLFTDDPDVLAMGRKLLLLAFLLEPGRAFNLVLNGSLRAAGDVNFPVIVGLICMWAFSVPMAWLLGLHWQFGLFGIFLSFILDEWTRGLIMLFRWRRKRWRLKTA